MGEVEFEDVADHDTPGELAGDVPGELGERRRTGEHRTGDPMQPAGAELTLTGHGDETRPLGERDSVGFEHDDRALQDSRRGGVESGRLHVDDRVPDSVGIG